MRSCQAITELVSEKIERFIPFTAQIELKMHLLLCKNCRRYAKQLQSIQKLLIQKNSELSNASLSANAKKRIEQTLTQAQRQEK